MGYPTNLGTQGSEPARIRPDITAQCEKQKQKRIPASLCLLQSRKEQLEKSLHNLIARIQPALGPHEEGPACPVAGPCVSDVQLEGSILSIAQDLGSLRDLIETVSSRVEL